MPNDWEPAAHYECLRCRSRWYASPGPGPGCYWCGHLYYRWLGFPFIQEFRPSVSRETS